MVDFSQYQPPGVYIEEELASSVNVVGARPAITAIVGPARGHRLFTETVSLQEGGSAPLTQTGVDTNSIVVTDSGGNTYEVGVHYTVSTDGEGVTSIEGIFADSESESGSESEGDFLTPGSYTVSYEYTDADYHNPARFTDFDDVQDAYGPPLDLDTGDILSPLSFAAKFAFENGARELLLCATTGSSSSTNSSELNAAYEKIQSLHYVNLVVPLPVGIENNDIDTVINGLRSHVENASAEGFFRLGVIGTDTAVTTDPDALADVSSSRVVLAYPNRLHYFHGFANLTLEVSGYYLAAAYAGRISSLRAHEPLTKKRIYGFSGFPASVLQTMTRANKNQWSSAGVAVTELTRQNTLVVRHGVATDVSSSQSKEISLTRARDALVTLLQETLDNANLIGSYIDDDTPGRVKGIVGGVLESAVSQDTIVSYNGLKVRQLTGDPSVIEVKFQYVPAYPLNYIVISFSVNTETGETTLLDQGN